MSNVTELRIPDLGDGVDEGVVIQVLVEVGQQLEAGQAVIEVETDKVTLEIPAANAGTVEAICVEADARVVPGDVVLQVSAAATDSGSAPAQAADSRNADQEPVAAVAAAAAIAAPAAPDTGNVTPIPSAAIAEATTSLQPLHGAAPAAAPRKAGAIVPAGPGARREARQLGIDISTLSGSGPRGRISRDDVRAAVRNRLHAVPAAPTPQQAGAPPLPDLATFGPVRRAAMTRIERATATNLARSGSIIPQAWVERRVDVTDVERARKRLRRRQANDDAPLTLTAMLCRAVALTLADFPKFNAAIDTDTNELVYREYVHIGVAVDTDHGLLVPVLRDVDRHDLRQVASELNRLGSAAREQRLEPAEMRGAGITISNLGSLGVSAMQPIVNWPEVAILGISGFDERLDLVDGTPVRRQWLPINLGFDHRVINGGDAARFLAALDDNLNEPLALAVSL